LRLSILGGPPAVHLLRWAFCLAWMVLGLCTDWGAENSVPLEYKVKAAFLYNFTRFVEWPPARFAANDGPLIIGICGRNPFGDELEHGLKGRSVNGHPIELRMVEAPESAKDVHLLFIPASEDGRASAWLKSAAGAGVLTVGETEKFADAGGMIRFVREADKVRFDINVEPAEQARLRVSAQLQKLARTVRQKT